MKRRRSGNPFRVELDRDKLEVLAHALHQQVKQIQEDTNRQCAEWWAEDAPEDRPEAPPTWQDLLQDGEWEGEPAFWLDGQLQEALTAVEAGHVLKISWSRH